MDSMTSWLVPLQVLALLGAAAYVVARVDTGVRSLRTDMAELKVDSAKSQSGQESLTREVANLSQRVGGLEAIDREWSDLRRSIIKRGLDQEALERRAP